MSLGGDNKKSIIFIVIALIAGVVGGTMLGATVGKDWFQSSLETYEINGSTTVQPVMTLFASYYNDMNPEVEISVVGTGSGTGKTMVGEGSIELGMSSSMLSANDLATKGANLRNWTIGLDGIGLIVNDATWSAISDLSTTGLTLTQLCNIYNGTYDTWDDVYAGAPAQTITVVGREEGSGTRAFFYDTVLEPSGSDFDAGMLLKSSNSLVKAEVEGTDYAIGYVGYAYTLTGSVNAIALDGSALTKNNIGSGTYPISRNLYLITDGVPQEGTLARGIIDFIHTPFGQTLVEEAGYIGLSQEQLNMYNITAAA